MHRVLSYQLKLKSDKSSLTENTNLFCRIQILPYSVLQVYFIIQIKFRITVSIIQQKNLMQGAPNPFKILFLNLKLVWN